VVAPNSAASPGDEDRSSSSWRRDLLGSAIAKAGFLIPTALVAFWALRSVSEGFGLTGLAVYSIVASIPTLLPFSDLGMGGTLTQFVANHPNDRHQIVRAYQSITIRVAIIAAFILVAALLLYATDTWPMILGIGDHNASAAATMVVILFAIGMPLSLGYRVLLGVQRNSMVVLLQSVSGVLGSSLVVILTMVDAPLPIVASAPMFAGTVFSMLGTLICVRALPAKAEGSGDSDWHFDGSVALAFLVTAVSAPITFQIDRILLGNLSTASQLADYTAVFQIYGPANALVIAAGQALWPRFSALRRGRGDALAKSFLSNTALFASAGAMIGVGLVVLSPIIAQWSTAGLADPSLDLRIFFALLITLNATLYPAGMFMVGGAAVRIQATCALITAIVKIVLAVTVFSTLGAAGMVASTLIAVFIFTGLPLSIYMTTYLVRRRKSPQT